MRNIEHLSVLILSTYSFAKPRHGGQVRLANIVKSYEAMGWLVSSVAVCESNSSASVGADLGPHDFYFPNEAPYDLVNGKKIPFAKDYLSGRYAASEGVGFKRLCKNLPSRIDVIQVEQPWMWPAACAIRQLPQYANALLVYSSHNIEAPLKRAILDSYQVADADDFVREIEQLERAICAQADLCLAVTSADLEVLKSYGATEVILAKNGIAPWFALPERVDYWRARLPSAPWLLYVASAHPPNFTGFTDCVGEALGAIPPDSRLVVAGSVGPHLQAVLEKTRWGKLNTSRLLVLGEVSDLDLAAIKHLAHAFLLPIEQGGGSNIKTAEALFSGAYVIATPAALRGFEDLMSLPEVFTARSPQEFQAAIQAVLCQPASPTHNVKPALGSLRFGLQWSQCLSHMPKAVQVLMAKRQAS